jgi:hypothetical protein
MASFDIRDTGPGIPAADMARIFEPFTRGSTVQAGGSGVGLTIARMLTDLMGGEMQVSSTPGEGSLFRIRLFLPSVHSMQAARELPKLNRIGYVGVRRRILMVDNERSIATCCKASLSRSALSSSRPRVVTNASPLRHTLPRT